eukprot:797732-Pelagomonas_calceolata.AAC.1
MGGYERGCERGVPRALDEQRLRWTLVGRVGASSGNPPFCPLCSHKAKMRMHMHTQRKSTKRTTNLRARPGRRAVRALHPGLSPSAEYS